MGLAVQGIAHEPGGVLTGHNASGHHFAAEGVTFADFLDIGRDPVIQCGDCGGFPGGFVCLAAELVGIAEGEVLGRYVLPQFPASAGSVV